MKLLTFLLLLLSSTTFAQRTIQRGQPGLRYYYPFLQADSVAVGAIIPTEKLDVNGKIRIRTVATGTLTDSPLVISAGVIKAIKPITELLRDSTGYYTVTGTTTDATPTNLIVIPVSIGYAISIEATCIAITADGDDAFSGIKHRAYHKTSGGTLTSLALTTIAPDAYVGGGLSTATFTLTNSGTDIALQVTGEAATTINWKIRYKLVSINVAF